MNTIIKKDIDCIATQFEKCVTCDTETNVPINQHVDYRYYYIEGAGQLCKKCYESIETKLYEY